MSSTPNRGYTYPDSTDNLNLWEHFEELATDIDTDVNALLSAAGVTGTSVITVASNFTLNQAVARTLTLANITLVDLHIELTYTGSNIVPSGTANISDTSCGTLQAAYRPTESRNVTFGTGGATGEIQIGNDGNCLMRSVDATLGNPTTIRFNAMFLKA